MQLRHITISLFAAVTTAQSNSNSTSLAGLVSQLPRCAISAFNSAASEVGCQTTDFTCLCGEKKQAFISEITPLVLSSGCSTDDFSKLQTLPGEICQAVANNPSSADVASASNIVTSEIGGATATSTPNAAAAMPQVSGVVMGAAALAVFAL